MVHCYCVDNVPRQLRILTPSVADIRIGGVHLIDYFFFKQWLLLRGPPLLFVLLYPLKRKHDSDSWYSTSTLAINYWAGLIIRVRGKNSVF